MGSNASYPGGQVRTDVHLTFLPGRHVGPYSAFGPGLIVSGDLPEGMLVTVRQEQGSRTFGPDRYGW